MSIMIDLSITDLSGQTILAERIEVNKNDLPVCYRLIIYSREFEVNVSFAVCIEMEQYSDVT